MNQLEQVLALIDQANQADPHKEMTASGARPREWLYGQRMSELLGEFAPGASEYLQIAARGQHIERWSSPRSDYPEGRTGYKKWRAELGLYHAKRVGELMQQAGYGVQDIDRVKYLVQKRGLKRDPETQCLEDVICLVFVRYYLDEFAAKHAEDKIIDIIQKTWAKMSEEGQKAALELPLSDTSGQLVQKALTGEAAG